MHRSSPDALIIFIGPAPRVVPSSSNLPTPQIGWSDYLQNLGSLYVEHGRPIRAAVSQLENQIETRENKRGETYREIIRGKAGGRGVKSGGWGYGKKRMQRNEEKRARKRARDAYLQKDYLVSSAWTYIKLYHAQWPSNLQQVRYSVYVVFPYFDEIRSFPRLFFRPSRLANYQRRKNNDVILLRAGKERRIISWQLLKLVNKQDADSDELSRSVLRAFSFRNCEIQRLERANRSTRNETLKKYASKSRINYWNLESTTLNHT